MAAAVTAGAFVEESATTRTVGVPMAHLSVELGHLYMDDFARGEGHLREHFRRVAPWVAAARAHATDALGRRARISTCFLIDDYFTQFSSPAVVLPQIIAAAGAAGLSIDYLVRESACAEADGVPLASLVHSRIVDDPPPRTTGERPPATESGWLCNGERSPGWQVMAALEDAPAWRPPSQNAAVNHSIFIDVEMWRDEKEGRLWSCPFLAAVWQLLRLGLLRDDGRPVAVPADRPPSWPAAWSELPAATRLTERPAPFAAYRTFSVLAPRFAAVETAVRTILSQVLPDAGVLAEIRSRADGENLYLPAEFVDRIEYSFTGASWSTPQ
ncbi:SCO2522 family protein [Hamadaea tsunoensis]|uniref:SCO2522 family protein n=1 Tax=Hamadaea tsunoensis TaxID=53368 RepID=UPI001FE0AA2C|nr:SCO2522 family protein [Hamadaea tsunoensis]